MCKVINIDGTPYAPPPLRPHGGHIDELLRILAAGAMHIDSLLCIIRKTDGTELVANTPMTTDTIIALAATLNQLVMETHGSLYEDRFEDMDDDEDWDDGD